MRTPAQLAKTTVVKNESRQGFQELVRQHTLRIAPRDAVEKTCSATQSFPDGLECLAHARGVPAGKNPRIRALRQPGEKNMSIRTQRGTPPLSRPLGRPAARTARRSLYPCASGHTSRSRGLQPVNPKNCCRRHPTKTQEKPATHAEPPLPAAGVFLVIGRGRNGGARWVRIHRPAPGTHRAPSRSGDG